MSTTSIPTEEEVLGYMTSLSNWGRWGSGRRAGDTEPNYPGKTGPGRKACERGNKRLLL